MTTLTDSRHTLAAVDTTPPRLQAFATLPLAERRAIVLALHVRDGLSQLEIARAVGVHPSTIGRQLQRAGVFSPRAPRADSGQPRPKRRLVLTPRELDAADRVAAHLRALPRSARLRVLQWSREVLADPDAHDATAV